MFRIPSYMSLKELASTYCCLSSRHKAAYMERESRSRSGNGPEGASAQHSVHARSGAVINQTKKETRHWEDKKQFWKSNVMCQETKSRSLREAQGPG